jgi:hypothetical protein
MKRIRNNILLLFFFFIFIKGGAAQNVISKKSIIKESILLPFWREHLSNNKEVIYSNEEAIMYCNVTNDTIRTSDKEFVFRTQGDCFQRAVAYYKFTKICHKKNKALVELYYRPSWRLCFYDEETEIYSLVSPPPIKFKLKFKIKENKLILKKHSIIDTKLDSMQETQICLMNKYSPLNIKQ